MAITCSMAEDRAQSTNLNTQASDSWTPAANTPYVLFTFATGEASVAPTCAGNGLTWTLRATQLQGVNDNAMFTAAGVASPTTGATTVTWEADGATGSVIAIYALTGANVSTPFVQKQSATFAGGATPTATFAATTTAGNAVLYACSDSNWTVAAHTPPSGYTEGSEIGFTIPNGGMSSGFHNNPGAITVVTMGGTVAANGALMIVEIAAAAGGAAEDIVDPMGMSGFFGQHHRFERRRGLYRPEPSPIEIRRVA